MNLCGDFKQAIELTEKNMEVYPASEADTLQAVVVISDGFNITEEDLNSSNAMLQGFMEKNMAFVFGIFSNEGLDILGNQIEKNISFSEATYLFNKEGSMYTMIVDQLVVNNNPLLSASGSGSVQALNDIYIIVDNELTYGAKIEIEYEIEAYALNGLVAANIKDLVSQSGLSFDPNAKLLTEDKTNADYGWEANSDGTVTNTFSSDEEGGSKPANLGNKIVLSKIISSNDENIFVNTAIVGTSSYGVGQNTPSSFQNTVQSEAVIIIPPTGVSDFVKIIITIGIILLMVILIFTIRKVKVKNKNK